MFSCWYQTWWQFLDCLLTECKQNIHIHKLLFVSLQYRWIFHVENTRVWKFLFNKNAPPQQQPIVTPPVCSAFFHGATREINPSHCEEGNWNSFAYNDTTYCKCNQNNCLMNIHCLPFQCVPFTTIFLPTVYAIQRIWKVSFQMKPSLHTICWNQLNYCQPIF